MRAASVISLFIMFGRIVNYEIKRLADDIIL